MATSQTILIELDALIDTRYGLVAKHFPDSLTDYDHDAYINRLYDKPWDIFKVDAVRWGECWQSRDIDVLKSSVATPIIHALRPMLSHLYVQGKTAPVFEPLMVDINIYPYSLDDDVCDAIIEELLASSFWDDCPVRCVSIPTVDLTPALIKSSYSAVLGYTIFEWLQVHSKALESSPIPTVTYYYPAYLHNDDAELMDATASSGDNPFHMARLAFASALSIIELDRTLFSLPHP